MQHNNALYCLTISTISGARLDKTHNFEVKENGFSFRAQFTPVSFIKTNEIGLPITVGGKVYFLGFDPEQLLKNASITKRDYEDDIRVEERRLETTKKKLNRDWFEVSNAVSKEMTEIAAKGGVPKVQTLPAPAPESAPAAPSAPQPQPPEQQPKPSTPPPPPAPVAQEAAKKETPPPAKAKEDSPDRETCIYNVYFAGVKASAGPKSQSAGYYAQIINTNTNQRFEVSGSGTCDNPIRLELVALKAAFESGHIPPSTKSQKVEVVINTPNSYIAKSFGYLRFWANNGWKKKGGDEVKHKDVFEAIYSKSQKVVVKTVSCPSDDPGYVYCCEQAKANADEHYQKNYGLIPPGNYTGGH